MRCTTLWRSLYSSSPADRHKQTHFNLEERLLRWCLLHTTHASKLKKEKWKWDAFWLELPLIVHESSLISGQDELLVFMYMYVSDYSLALMGVFFISQSPQHGMGWNVSRIVVQLQVNCVFYNVIGSLSLKVIGLMRSKMSVKRHQTLSSCVESGAPRLVPTRPHHMAGHRTKVHQFIHEGTV